MRYLTDRKRATGLGAGGAGSHHHWKMIVSSISICVLTPFFITTFGLAFGRSYDDAIAFLSHPVSVVIMALSLIVGIQHFKMEIDEAVEDYVGGIARKLTLVAVTAFSYTLMALGLFALLKIAL